MSGIISLICCGLAQAQFARLNISRKSFITVRYITKTLSALADNVIFIFLGMLLVQQTHQFNPGIHPQRIFAHSCIIQKCFHLQFHVVSVTGFFSTSFLFAVIHRFVSIYLLSYLSNRLYRRARVIRPNEQFLMAYGGLRGAIAFSLAFSMPPFLVHRQLLTSSTLQLVVASVFLFGCTMKPLVRYLRISSNTTPELSLLECMNRRVQLYTLAGIENLIGQKSFNAYAERYVRLNERRLRPMLVNSSAMHNQLAVELRFMLEQLYVKHTNPHTEIPPPPHSPGNAVRFIGQTLFQRVRRLSSMRRSSGSSSDRRNKNAKRRPTDEAIALQRSQREEGTLDAFASRRSRRSAGESPLFCTPIRMPVPPPPPRIPSPPPTKKADKRNDSNKSTKSRKGDKSDKSCTNNNEHRVQIETIGGSQYQSKPPKPIMRQSQNQLTVPGAPSVSITNVDEPATVAHWQSIPELQILQIPVLDEATGVWITHGQRHSLEGDVIGAHRLLTGSGSTGSQLGSYLHSHHHQLRRASLQATNAANERQLVKTRLSSLPIATMNVRLATLGSSEPTQQTREAASMMAARYRRNARLRSEGRSQHMQRHVVVPSQFGLGNRSIRRKAKASQYTVYNHVNEWDRTNSMKQTDDHRLISIADTHARSHSADSIGKPRF